jgi:two-component system, sensor histidine kinase and response regulator
VLKINKGKMVNSIREEIPTSSVKDNGPFQSLSRITLIQMGIRITVVVIAVAFLSYQHIISTMEEKTLDELSKYITERGQKESAIFTLAQDNHQIFKGVFLKAWKSRGKGWSNAYGDIFYRADDGTTRIRSKAFEGVPRADGTISHSISGYVGRSAPVHELEFQDRLLLTYRLLDRFGEAWSHRFANLYASMPQNVNLVYWSGLPWGSQASAELDVNTEEWVYIANAKNNPKRQSVWTGLYYDKTADEWMVSCETPVYEEDHHLINVGHDILLNKLFERVFNDHLKGTYNFIFRGDGRLIAHPHKVAELRDGAGVVSIPDLADLNLSGMVDQIMASLDKMDNQVLIIKEGVGDNFLAVSRIKGPDWLFVTVYPKTLLSTTAGKAAQFILFIGFISLVVELLMLFLVLRRNVIVPLNKFVIASKEVRDGHYQDIINKKIPLPDERRDEVGLLATTFHSMACHISDYQESLNERTAQLEETNSNLESFLYTVSHDFRTQLRTLDGFSNLILEEYEDRLDKTGRGYLSNLRDGSRDMHALIEGLLALSRSLKSTLSHEIVDLSEGAQVVVQELEKRSLDRWVSFKISPKITAHGDKLLIQTLLENLLGNAWKFTAPVPDALIEFSCENRNGETVYIVRDNGAGFDMAHKDMLFRPFYQLHKPGEFGGSGVGLCLTKQIVERHKGRIWAESEVGKGATFYFTLAGS